jgi:hypothetical protein
MKWKWRTKKKRTSVTILLLVREQSFSENEQRNKSIYPPSRLNKQHRFPELSPPSFPSLPFPSPPLNKQTFLSAQHNSAWCRAARLRKPETLVHLTEGVSGEGALVEVGWMGR